MERRMSNMTIVYNSDKVKTVEDVTKILAGIRQEAIIDLRDAVAYGSPNAQRMAYHDLFTIEDIMVKLGMLVEAHE